MSSNKLMAVALFFIILSFFISISPYIPGLPNPVKEKGSFDLTMEIAPKTLHNVTEYAYYVVVDGTEYSSSSINVPSNVTVKITIYNQDPGYDKLLNSKDANVTGTVYGYLDVTDYSPANTSASHQVPSEGTNVTVLPSTDISHTFTVNNGLNIPVPPLSTVVTYATFDAPGIYSWGCMCQCGAMSMNTSGWMYGTLVVS